MEELRPNLKKWDYLLEFETFSKKLRSRLAGLKARPEVRVLRNLINAETANIRAKFDSWNETRNYSAKRRYLRAAIADLPATGWKFYFQKSYPGTHVGNYVFYVVLPGGLQVSWHGLDWNSDMEGVPEDYGTPWDGVQGVTLERLVSVANAL